MTIIESGLRPHPAYETPFGNIRNWFNLYAKRRRFNRLLDLDDRMLDDIGVTREEVQLASKLPLSANAGNQLRMTSERRRAKEKWRR